MPPLPQRWQTRKLFSTSPDRLPLSIKIQPRQRTALESGHHTTRKTQLAQCLRSFVRLLAGELVEGNARHVEVFAGTEQPFNCIADLESRSARHISHAEPATEHRADVFHIGVKPTSFEVQRGPSPAHGGTTLRTGPADRHFGSF